MLKIWLLILTVVLSSCISETEPIETSNNYANLMKSGDIVVVNNTNDAIVLLDSSGTFKTTLYSEFASAALTFPALTFDSTNNRLLFTYDHTTAGNDKIMYVDAYDLSTGTAYYNSTIFSATGETGIAKLRSGEYVVLEAATTLEKFTSSWSRLGAPATSTLVTSVSDVQALRNGDILICSSGTGQVVATAGVKIYSTAAGSSTITATALWAASTTPGTTLGASVGVSGCAQDQTTGKIAVAFTGATDGVALFSEDLTTRYWNWTNTSYLATPGKITFRANGNILVTDTGLNHIVELTQDGQFVRTIGGSILAGPIEVLVIP